jgi:GDP-L-fucose synthase
MIRKFHEAKVSRVQGVTLWGSGTPRREFLHVDDLADACLFLLQEYDDPEIINIGVGEDLSIAELADMVRGIVGFEGEIEYDAAKPDGTPRKLVDTTKINGLGWKASIGLCDGIEATYSWFLENAARLRKEEVPE